MDTTLPAVREITSLKKKTLKNIQF
jgi:hypothetical protein